MRASLIAGSFMPVFVCYSRGGLALAVTGGRQR
jgi:hypothetical protein